MPKAMSSLARGLDAWAEDQLANRFPGLAKLHVRTLYRYAALTTTLAWLVLRIPAWGPRGVRVVLGLLASWLLAVLVIDVAATQVRLRRKQRPVPRTRRR